MCVCVSLYLLHIEHPGTHSTGKVRTFVQHGAILAGPDDIKGLSEG